MIQSHYLAGLLLFISGCRSQARNEEKEALLVDTGRTEVRDKTPSPEHPFAIDTAALGIRLKPRESYGSVKAKVVSVKEQIKDATDSVKKITLENILLNDLFPFWYETPWDFNGITEIPGEGRIACGYFVSTLMKHAGFNLNRYKLAQLGALDEAKSIGGNTPVDVYPVTAEELQKIFNRKYTEGLFFAGLDFHVGFLLFRSRELYFIHSDYINARGVVFEKATASNAFCASGAYWIMPLSGNHELIEKWVAGTELKMVSSGH